MTMCVAPWLVLVAVVAMVTGTCDKNLLPENTYYLSGSNIAFPCSSTKSIYIQSDRYISKNILPARTQIYKDEAFVIMPRYKPGVPITLGKISLKTNVCQATVEPYPCWSQQEEGNCHSLQSAVDAYLCGQDLLWVLDTGIVNTLEQPIRRCPPKIVAYNVKNGRLVKTIDLSDLIVSASRPQYLVVDYNAEGNCFVYVSDAATRAILVYDVSNSKGWRVVLPPAVTQGCNGRDVLYLALVRKPSGTSVLHFTYLSSTRLFSIKTEFLQKGNTGGRVIDVGAKPGKMVLLGTDNGAAIFFRLKGESDIYMWNTEGCMKKENFLLVQRGDDCRLATQVVPGYKRLMWVIESNFHDFITNTVGCAGASVVLHPIVKTCD